MQFLKIEKLRNKLGGTDEGKRKIHSKFDSIDNNSITASGQHVEADTVIILHRYTVSVYQILYYKPG